MAQDDWERLSGAAQERLVTALRVALWRCEQKGIKGDLFEDMLYQANLGMVPEKLARTRNLLKAMIGYDPLAEDTHPQAERKPKRTKSESGQKPSLQDLKRKIYSKAKAEPQKRFWGLYVHVSKMETLREAYRVANRNNGAPGVDGVSFEDIEARGVEEFLEEIRTELVERTYRPQRVRKVEIPKEGTKKTRQLSIPTIRDRVVQGALTQILEPIFESDFQPGSYGYRPKRSGHQALGHVSKAINQGKTLVIDLDLKSYFDNVRHHLLFEKVAKRVDDDDIMRLLKLIVKATGKKGVPQGGVISPLLSNIYLTEVDRMLERAQKVTQAGKYTQVEYARYADDLVILVHDRYGGRRLLAQVQKRLKEELDKLQVAVNEEKTRVVDLRQDGTIGFLGFTFRRVKSRRGKWWAMMTPQGKKRTALLRRLKEKFRVLKSQSISTVIGVINPILRGWVTYFRVGNSSKTFGYIRHWVEKKVRRHMMRVRQRRGFGWKRWSSELLYGNLELYNDYQIRWYSKQAKARPC